MTTAQVVETSVTVNNNSPIQDYVYPDDQAQSTFAIYSTYTVTLKYNSKLDYISIIFKIPKDFYQKT